MKTIQILINKYQEMIRYLVVGVLTTAVGLSLYYLLVWTCLNPENTFELQLANILSWIVSVIFAYITNRKFVFQSKNQNIAKEAISFAGSRVVTLLLDMAIMYVGVSLLKYNNTWVKLGSQIVVILSNYGISKLFVFRQKEPKEKKESNRQNIIYLLYFFPILDFITSIYAWNNTTFYLNLVIKGLLCLLAFFVSFQKSPKKESFLLVLGYFIVEALYILASKYPLLEYGSILLKTFYFPLLVSYFTLLENPKLNQSFLVKIFYSYLLLLIIPKCFGLGHNISEIYPNKDAYLSFFFSGNELSATLLCLLPIVLDSLKKHHNCFVKLLGSLFIIVGFALLKTKTLILGFILTVIYLLWKDRKRKTNYFVVIPTFILIATLLIFTLVQNFDVALKYYEIDDPQKIVSVEFLDRVILSSRITSLKEVHTTYQQASLKEKLFGLGNLNTKGIKTIEIDILDIFYSLGIIGFIVYMILLITVLKKVKLKGTYAFGFYLTLLVSCLSGHILTSPMVSLWLASLVLATKNHEEKKTVLMVANLYPSKKHKHYGSFVKNTEEQLQELNFKVTRSVMKKHTNPISKLFAYAFFYTKTFWKALFGSYDIIYVHYISHSTWPVLFGYRFTKQTKLILNAHGNDVINDYAFEEKNIKRSRKYLKKADLVVVSSKYFQRVIHENYQFPLEKIIVYPAGGVDFDRFKPLDKAKMKKELKLDEQISYIGLVSRIEKDKGYDTLIEALYMLKEEPWMENTKLIIIGNGNEQAYLNQKIKKYHLEDLVIQKEFVYQQDLAKYYNAFDLFIFPTKRKSESLGLVGLEAMACKTFVIGCSLYGPSEYLIDQENCFAYEDTKTAKQLARKIRAYYKLSIEEKERILENAYQTAKKFSKENSIDILKTIVGETNENRNNHIKL